jgi:biopolymer transport protein ExbB/TolQ
MQSFNLIEMWHSMAPLAKMVNILLAVCSIYSLWVIIDRFIALRGVRISSAKFVGSLRDQLKFRSVDGALQLSTHQNDSPVARMVKEALTEYREGQDLTRGRPAHDSEYDSVEAVERVVERVKEREQADLKRGLGGLASISSAAPFIGLFGTVVGIINAFRSMAATGQGGLGAVSAGISEALFTTAVGLVVAIPAVMTFNYYSTVIERFMVDMNGVGSELVSFVLREAGSAPSHASHGAPASMHPQHMMHRPTSQHPSQHPPPVHPSQHPSPMHAHGPTSQHSPVAPPVSGYPPHYPPR